MSSNGKLKALSTKMRDFKEKAGNKYKNLYFEEKAGNKYKNFNLLTKKN